jgi:hypothetical protein
MLLSPNTKEQVVYFLVREAVVLALGSAWMSPSDGRLGLRRHSTANKIKNANGHHQLMTAIASLMMPVSTDNAPASPSPPRDRIV